MTFWTDIL